MRKALFAVLAATSLGAWAQVERKDFPCAVYLCLGDPRGATAEPACKPPIDWLYDLLRHRKPFPRCEDAEKEGMSVQFVHDHYNRCPEPLVAAPAGAYVAPGRMVTTQRHGRSWQAVQLTDDPAMSEQGADYGFPGPRACVGNPVGTQAVGGGDGGGYEVMVYDTVAWLPARNPRAIDLYVNGAWVTRNRY